MIDVDEYRKLRAKEMSEDVLLESIIDLAHTYGWLVAHFRPAKTDQGWRTPVQADGKGFPDLVMLKAGEMVIAECKSQNGQASEEQKLWIMQFMDLACKTEAHGQPVKVFLWRPEHWFSGKIERILRG